MRTPYKGSIVNPWPAANTRNMMGQGAFLSLGGGFSVKDAFLYNNSADGTYLAVWQCSVDVFAGAATTAAGVTTQAGQAPQQLSVNPLPALPLQFDQAPGYGLVDVNIAPVGLNFGFINIGQANNYHWEWSHEWPMAYVPKGYTLTIEASADVTGGSVAFSVSFIWEAGVRLN